MQYCRKSTPAVAVIFWPCKYGGLPTMVSKPWPTRSTNTSGKAKGQCSGCRSGAVFGRPASSACPARVSTIVNADSRNSVTWSASSAEATSGADAAIWSSRDAWLGNSARSAQPTTRSATVRSASSASSALAFRCAFCSASLTVTTGMDSRRRRSSTARAMASSTASGFRLRPTFLRPTAGSR